MTGTDIYIQRLLESNPLRESLLRRIIQEQELPKGSHGLDAGCGIGLQMPLLFQEVGDRGRITGLDILPELIAFGRNMIEKIGLSDRITFWEGDVNQLPFEEDTFDWVWSADCVGYPAGELDLVLKELMRVTKPGGDVILLGWSSQQVLPGYPLLEARLNATCSAYLPYLRGKSPESNFMRVMDAFHKAGLKDVSAHTFVDTIQSPLREECKTAVTSLLDMLWGAPQPEVSQADWQEYQRLCKPTSPDFILNLPNYYGFFTYSVFRGKVDKTPLRTQPKPVRQIDR